MPIRIEHQPSAFAVGVAGYAAGRGAARERQGKYALDLWQQNRQQEQQQAAWEQRQNQQNQFMDMRDQRRFLQGRATELPMVPDDLTDADQRNTLSRQRIGLGKMAGMIDPRDAAQMEAFEQGILDYMDALGKAPRADTAEKARRGMVWYNPDNPSEFSGKEVPGWIATQGQGFDPASVVADKANRQQALAEKQQQAAEKEYATAESNRNSWLTRRAAIAEKIRAANDSLLGNDPLRIPESQIMEKATEQMAAEGWGQEPRLPTLRPGEKPHMGSPALGPEITPLSPEEAAQVGGGAPAGEHPIVVGPGMVAQPVSIPGQAPTGPQATPGAAAALRDPNTQASPIPLAPRSNPQASVSPYVEEVTPVVGELAGMPQREPQDPEVQVVPYGKPTTEPQASMPKWEQGAVAAGMSPSQIGELGLSYQEDNSQPMAKPNAPAVSDWATEAWPEPINASGKPLGSATPSVDRVAEVMPKITAGMQQQRLEQFTPEMLRQARRIAQTPAGRAALQERYGVDFAMPQEQPAAPPPVDTTQRQHVEAMRGPQGTGEGIPSDAERIAGSVQGAGSLAGRTAGYARRDAGQLGPGQTRTTKYNVTPTAAERESAMNQRFERANQMQQEREMMARASGIAPPTAGPARPKPTSADVAVNQSKRKSKESARSNAVAAQGIREGIDRAQRLGKPVPAVQRAILAALTGDVTAQKALDERGIRWRT